MSFLVRQQICAIGSLWLLFSLTPTVANDSAGYVGTGGVTYIKDHNISMQKEDLYLSKDKVEVNYQFKNLSNHDITHTILFLLPALPNFIDSDFADTHLFLDQFQVWSNHSKVYPTLHVRVFMYPINHEEPSYVAFDPKQRVDVTEIFKSCGISDQDMLSPWTLKGLNVAEKLKACPDERVAQFVDFAHPESLVFWESQPIYSWQQTFKAKAMTKLKHRYPPLVGGGVHLGKEQFADFCVENETDYSSPEGGRQYAALKYILTTGANWATPIKDFTLTVERDVDEAVSFCWQGKGRVEKIGPTTFQIKEKNFIPTHDFEAVFVRVR